MHLQNEQWSPPLHQLWQLSKSTSPPSAPALEVHERSGWWPLQMSQPLHLHMPHCSCSLHLRCKRESLRGTSTCWECNHFLPRRTCTQALPALAAFKNDIIVSSGCARLLTKRAPSTLAESAVTHVTAPVFTLCDGNVSVVVRIAEHHAVHRRHMEQQQQPHCAAQLHGVPWCSEASAEPEGRERTRT